VRGRFPLSPSHSTILFIPLAGIANYCLRSVFVDDLSAQALVWSIFFGEGETNPDPNDWNKAGDMLEEIVNERK
jgi:hypothetical protein